MTDVRRVECIPCAVSVKALDITATSDLNNSTGNITAAAAAAAKEAAEAAMALAEAAAGPLCQVLRLSATPCAIAGADDPPACMQLQVEYAAVPAFLAAADASAAAASDRAAAAAGDWLPGGGVVQAFLTTVCDAEEACGGGHGDGLAAAVWPSTPLLSERQ